MRSLTRITYDPGDGSAESVGVAALGRALEHVNLAWALAGMFVRLPGVCSLLQVAADASGGGPNRVVRYCERPASPSFKESEPLKFLHPHVVERSRSRALTPIERLDRLEQLEGLMAPVAEQDRLAGRRPELASHDRVHRVAIRALDGRSAPKRHQVIRLHPGSGCPTVTCVSQLSFFSAGVGATRAIADLTGILAAPWAGRARRRRGGPGCSVVGGGPTGCGGPKRWP